MMVFNQLASSLKLTTTHIQIGVYRWSEGSRTSTAQLWKSSNFTIESTGANSGTVTFHCSGPFTGRDMYSSLTPAALQNLLDSSISEPETVQIFDLTHVPYMDSTALGVLVNHLLRCKSKGIRSALTGVNARVLELLKMTRTDTLVEISGTVEEGILEYQTN